MIIIANVIRLCGPNFPPTPGKIFCMHSCWLCYFHIRHGQIHMVGSTVIGNGGGKITLQVSHYDR